MGRSECFLYLFLATALLGVALILGCAPKKPAPYQVRDFRNVMCGPPGLMPDGSGRIVQNCFEALPERPIEEWPAWCIDRTADQPAQPTKAAPTPTPYDPNVQEL